MNTVRIATDFTRFPSGRYKKSGATSGEAFREIFLQPALQRGEVIAVDFDGTVGYGSSFLEEAFGGVVRALKMTPQFVLAHLQLKSTDPTITEEVIEYINDAGRQLQ